MTAIHTLILGNVLIDDRADAWGVYRVPTPSYPLLPATRKAQLMEQLSDFAHRACGDLTFWRVTRCSQPDADDSAADRLVECYAAVRLDTDAAHGIAGRILRTPRRVPARLTLTRRVVDQLTSAERDRRAHARATLDARPATSRELTWLTTRLRTLGLGEPESDPHETATALAVLDTDTVIVEPTSVQVHQLAEIEVIEHDTSIELRTSRGTVHQAALSLGALPDGLDFPGRAELASTPLERCDAIADLVIHARWTSNASALKSAARTIVDADNATSEQASTGRVSDTRLQTQLDTALDYKRYLESDQAPPILSATMTAIVAAPTAELLDQACSRLTTALAPLHVTRPRYLQRRLWNSAQQPRRCADGARAQHMTAVQLAALMPHATELTGTETGPHIGAIRTSRRPVHLDLTTASQSDRPPSILCVGTLGSGKTMTAQLIAYQALQRDFLVVDVDPKPDHRLDQLDIAQRTSVIDLSDTAQHEGLLDPLRISDDAMRDEVAAGFYADLIDATPKQRALLRSSLTQLSTHPAPSSAQLIATLEDSPQAEAHEIAEQLRAWSHSGLARLALGTPTTSGDVTPSDLTSIRCRSLALPDATTPRSDYTEAERVSCAIMRLIATYALRLALTDSSRPKLVMIDEAWVLLGSPDGRALIDRINRTGRSENATLLLATQQLTDAAHTAPLIGTRMVFGLETASEADHAAVLLGTDATDELAHELCGQRTGQAVMRDIHGRLARIQIQVPPQLLAALATAPRGGAS